MIQNKLRIFHLSGTSWIPSYRDFDFYDTKVLAISKENAIEVFKDDPMSKLCVGEPCVQTSQEWSDMWERMKTL